jgi:hypothetical protein
MKNRRKNPSPSTIAMIIGGIAVSGGVGYYLWQRSEKTKAKPKPSGKPLAASCEAKPKIPNYRLAVLQTQTCGTCKYVETSTTGLFCEFYDEPVSSTCVCKTWAAEPAESDMDEYGLSFSPDCSDFTMVEPVDGDNVAEDHWQAKILKEVVDEAASRAEFNPFDTAAAVLNLVSPSQCEFPPSPEAPERIVQLYLYFVNLTAVIGMMSGGKVVSMIEDGKVIEAKTIKDLDNLIPKMTEQLGYPEFDPAVVPDLLPEPPEPPAGGGDLPIVGSSNGPMIDSISPAFMTAKSSPTQVYAYGDLDPETEISLINEDTLEEIEGLEASHYGPGTILMSVKSMKPGRFVAHVRQSGEDTWIPTDAVLEVRLAQAGLNTGNSGGSKNIPGLLT